MNVRRLMRGRVRAAIGLVFALSATGAASAACPSVDHSDVATAGCLAAVQSRDFPQFSDADSPFAACAAAAPRYRDCRAGEGTLEAAYVLLGGVFYLTHLGATPEPRGRAWVAAALPIAEWFVGRNLRSSQQPSDADLTVLRTLLLRIAK